MLFTLAYRNIISRKSSLVIILFIALFVALLLVSNALFDGTDRGIREVYGNSFTGDIVIRPNSAYPLSLFGDDTPITGELSKIELLSPYAALRSLVESNSRIAGSVSQITGYALMEINGARIPSVLFGVEAEDYLPLMSAITIEEGAPFARGERGIMLSYAKAREIEEETDTNLNIGDTIQFVVQEGPTFRIRAAPLTGLYSYAVSNSMLERIVLTDPITLRSLLALDSRVFVSDEEIPEQNANLMNSGSIDDLFAGDGDRTAEEAEMQLSEEQFRAEPVEEESEALASSWNFIIIKAKNSAQAPLIIRELNKTFKENGWSLNAINWRYAAGSTALYVYWLRIIFNVGVLIVLATGFIVVNNTLVISILDRTREIGTLRAIGAKRRFVSSLFLTETMLLTITAGISGCLIGAITVQILRKIGITLTNDFLIQLFGGDRLIPVLTFETVSLCFLLSCILGLIGWMYPVRFALTTSPVVAMRGSH